LVWEVFRGKSELRGGKSIHRSFCECTPQENYQNFKGERCLKESIDRAGKLTSDQVGAEHSPTQVAGKTDVFQGKNRVKEKGQYKNDLGPRV